MFVSGTAWSTLDHLLIMMLREIFGSVCGGYGGRIWLPQAHYHKPLSALRTAPAHKYTRESAGGYLYVCAYIIMRLLGFFFQLRAPTGLSVTWRDPSSGTDSR